MATQALNTQALETQASDTSDARAGALARAVRWIERRSPVISRRQHARELRALESAAQSLCVAVRDATRASALALEQWRVAAEKLRQERDDARAEVERLRATVAELVLDGRAK